MTTATAPTGAITLRPLRWWDLDDAERLEAGLFPDPWTPAMFWSELAGVPATRYYVAAVREEQLVGYAGLFVSGSDADVLTVAVAPDAQGAGLGARLLDDLLDEARRRACSRVTLEVREDNAAARALYERRGFAGIGTRKGYYPPDGADAVVMQLRLRPEGAA